MSKSRPARKSITRSACSCSSWCTHSTRAPARYSAAGVTRARTRRSNWAISGRLAGVHFCKALRGSVAMRAAVFGQRPLIICPGFDYLDFYQKIIFKKLKLPTGPRSPSTQRLTMGGMLSQSPLSPVESAFGWVFFLGEKLTWPI